MNSYSEQELLDLMAGGESLHCEFKADLSSKDNKERICRTICAFANDITNQHKNGVILLGVSDDGNPSGLEISDKLELQIQNIKGEGKIIPLPTFVTTKQMYRGQEILRIEVSPAISPPVKYEGKVWVRPGNATMLASIEDERQLFSESRRPQRLQPDDCLALPHCQISDLNLQFFKEEYLPQAISREVLLSNGRSLEEQLCSTKMAAGFPNISPTVLGILSLAFSPTDAVAGAYVQFVRYSGLDLNSAVTDQKEFHGRVSDVIIQTEAKFHSHNQIPIDYKSQPKELQFPEYPKIAFEQLFRNAVLHRAYVGSNAPIRFYWFSDRIEISNPGGPFEMTTEEFGQPYKTGYRNPNLAAVLKEMGFVQKFGSGISLARAALKENRNPDLLLEASPNFVTATMFKSCISR
jgi:ATP-dependent DNA helicase RecG